MKKIALAGYRLQSIRYLLLGGLLVSSVLTGCSRHGTGEVQRWMDETRRNTPISIPKISEPKKFEPYVYASENQVDPFSPTKLAVALAKMQGQGGAFKPDLERRREELEQYPLDSISMVGVLQKKGMVYAILQVPGDSGAQVKVYRVKVGNYIGQNFGLVTEISDTGLELKEVVQDAAGEWVERKASLLLQGMKK